MSTLSRTASELFWMTRYLERAEAMARLVEMGRRMAMLPSDRETAADEWRSVIAASGCAPHFEGRAVDERAAVLGLITDRENPSSIVSCFDRARQNARSVRTALTTQSWETLNEAWLKLGDLTEERVLRELPQTLDWVKGRCAQFRGAADATMLRDDRYDFGRLGIFIERADMTLRLLDVKHFVLLPETEVVGGGRDRHQWTSVLMATSALRAYHWAYRGDYSPWRIADFLILNHSCPRSLAYCYDEIIGVLDRLARAYGARHPCHHTATETVAMLADIDIGEIFHDGLHEFLIGAVARNNRLAYEIGAAYHF
ncbi:MAG: alpha-E domain-containing protein [Rhodobacteraceae bacterium]|nr:MAG: alpha-E domain-containing protein [Paracoccaceae bacterium]